ncbi:hypothetical protein CF327_g539 [Tilletia walkeri]|nr:hypothetical protein CF327_g539 [Tilletia walkeri]
MAEHFNTAPPSAPSPTSTTSMVPTISSDASSSALPKDSMSTSHTLLAQVLLSRTGEEHRPGQRPHASFSTGTRETDPDNSNEAGPEPSRSVPRASSLTVAEALRSAAQAELVRMQHLQEQRRRRSTSAALRLGPAVRAAGSYDHFASQGNQQQFASNASATTTATWGHKRQWDETVSSSVFLEQAGAVAHQFGEFFTQERAWAGMALAAATRRDSEHSSSENAGMSRNSTDLSSVSTSDSRASFSGWTSTPQWITAEEATAASASNMGPPPAKRLRTNSSLSDPLQMASSSRSGSIVQFNVPSIVQTRALPDLMSGACSSTAVTSTSSSSSLSPLTVVTEVDPLSSSNGSRPGALASLLSDFAQMLEGRQEVARGLEELARNGQTLVTGSSTAGATTTCPVASSAAGTNVVGAEGVRESPSAESDDAPEGETSLSEWTESSIAGDTPLAAISPSGDSLPRSSSQQLAAKESGSGELGTAEDANQQTASPVAGPSSLASNQPAVVHTPGRYTGPGLGPLLFDSGSHADAPSPDQRRSRSVSPPTSDSRPPLVARTSSPAYLLFGEPGHTAADLLKTSKARAHPGGVNRRSPLLGTVNEGRERTSSPIVSGWCAWRVPSQQPKRRTRHAGEGEGEGSGSLTPALEGDLPAEKEDSEAK